MKLLMFNVKEFWYKTFSKTLQDVEENEREETIQDTLVVFGNVEMEDEEKLARIVRKTVKNITWLAGKTGRNRVVLHSFAHLSESKSSVKFAEKVFKSIEDRLRNKGYDVLVTPFGYFLEFKLHVLGESLAKVWKVIN